MSRTQRVMWNPRTDLHWNHRRCAGVDDALELRFWRQSARYHELASRTRSFQSIDVRTLYTCLELISWVRDTYIEYLNISRTHVSNSLISVDRRTDSIYVSWTLFMSSWHIYWISLFLTNSCLESHFADLLSLKLQETLSTEMSGCETWVSEIFYVCVTNSWYEFLGKITLCSIIGNTIDHNVIFPKKCRTSRTHVTNSHTALI